MFLPLQPFLMKLVKNTGLMWFAIKIYREFFYVICPDTRWWKKIVKPKEWSGDAAKVVKIVQKKHEVLKYTLSSWVLWYLCVNEMQFLFKYHALFNYLEVIFCKIYSSDERQYTRRRHICCIHRKKFRNSSNFVLHQMKISKEKRRQAVTNKIVRMYSQSAQGNVFVPDPIDLIKNTKILCISTSSCW